MGFRNRFRLDVNGFGKLFLREADVVAISCNPLAQLLVGGVHPSQTGLATTTEGIGQDRKR